MEFEKNLHERYGLSSAAVDTLLAHLETLRFGRRSTVLGEGDADRYAWFVEQGSVRSYVLREGKCVTTAFAFEGDAAVPILGPTPDGISRVTIETLEPSVLVRIPRRRLDGLFGVSPELAKWGRRVAERNLAQLERYFTDYFWADKGTQYRMLVAEYPELLRRVSLRELASYLHVTPQTLSRIRTSIR